MSTPSPKLEKSDLLSLMSVDPTTITLAGIVFGDAGQTVVDALPAAKNIWQFFCVLQ